MTAGRPRKPVNLHVIQGTFRPDRHGKRLAGEPQPAGALGAPPAWFTDAQREVWASALCHAPVGLLRALDGPHLAVWAVAADIHRQATVMLNELGQDALTGPDGQKARVLVAIVNGQARIMQKLGGEMGFSPVSRARVTVDPRVDSNPFDEFGA